MSELLVLWMCFASAAKGSLEANLAPMAIGGANTVLLWQISRKKKQEEEKQFGIDAWHQFALVLGARTKQMNDAVAAGMQQLKDMTYEQRQQLRLHRIWRERKKKHKDGIVDEFAQFRTNRLIKRRKKDTNKEPK